ncbi:unnamed protein product [Rotaria sordida]|uniref:Uncharacterized protein n=1 Tax=Rotaria sordida TaxID=392033 RepID=A0A815V1G3_9BILA|nr:unnamed protein product [Rotaria sordida]
MQAPSSKTFQKISVLPSSSPGQSSRLTEIYSLYEFKANEGDTTSRGSQCIRLKLDTGADKIVTIMEEAWNLERPDIIIFVMDEAEDDDASVQLPSDEKKVAVSIFAITR